MTEEGYEYYRGVFNGLVYRIDLYNNVEVYQGHEQGWSTSWGTIIGEAVPGYDFADRVRSGIAYAALDEEPLDVIA